MRHARANMRHARAKCVSRAGGSRAADDATWISQSDVLTHFDLRSSLCFIIISFSRLGFEYVQYDLGVIEKNTKLKRHWLWLLSLVFSLWLIKKKKHRSSQFKESGCRTTIIQPAKQTKKKLHYFLSHRSFGSHNECPIRDNQHKNTFQRECDIQRERIDTWQ